MKSGKLLLRVILGVAILALVSFGAANTAVAEITDSAHDFAGSSWNSTSEICIVCHTPHRAVIQANFPLWNHAVTSATYQLYSSATLNATPGQPAGASRACLSCHDGTVALNSFGGNTGNIIIDPSYRVGIDLRDDHPITFTYDTALSQADPGLKNPATTASGLGGTIQHDLLIADKLECSSCHDVHNKYNQPGLLVKSNTASLLCLTCHSK